MTRAINLDRRLYYPDEFKPRTVYGLIDPRDGKVHYIGVTADFPRRIKNHLSPHSNNKPLNQWKIELKELGLKFVVRVFGVEPDVVSGGIKEAELIRKFYIEGHPLKNRKSIFHGSGKLVKEIQQALSTQ